MTNKVLSTSLCYGITQWILGNNYLVDVLNLEGKAFKQVDNYYRVDYPVSEMTALSVYMLNSDTKSEPQKENGQVALQITYNLGEQRDYRSSLIYGTMEMLRANILSNINFIQKYLSKNFVPGLTYINSQSKIDYAPLNSQINLGQGSTNITLIMEYKIDIYLNQKYHLQNGYDLYSPNNILYQQLTGFDFNETVSVKRQLNIFNVTPSIGYPASGILIIPNNYIGNGLLLGDNGTIYQSNLLPNTNKIGYIDSYYVNQPNPSIGYVSTGLLITKSNAVVNNSALLFGDNGIMYRTVYNNNNYSPIKYQFDNVFKIGNYQQNGTLLSIISPEKGNAGILFGNDNNFYETTIN